MTVGGGFGSSGRRGYAGGVVWLRRASICSSRRASPGVRLPRSDTARSHSLRIVLARFIVARLTSASLRRFSLTSRPSVRAGLPASRRDIADRSAAAVAGDTSVMGFLWSCPGGDGVDLGEFTAEELFSRGGQSGCADELEQALPAGLIERQVLGADDAVAAPAGPAPVRERPVVPWRDDRLFQAERSGRVRRVERSEERRVGKECRSRWL